MELTRTMDGDYLIHVRPKNQVTCKVRWISISNRTFQPCRQGGFALQADEAIDQLAVFEQKKRGDAVDAEAGTDGGVLVGVEFGYQVATAGLGGELVDGRRDHAAWAAPGRPTIQ